MRVHIVQKGDTLWKIAKQYAVGFEELKRLNAHLANPDYIVPGMEIYLPNIVPKKEKEMMQQTIVKEQEKPMKEAVVPTPTPLPAPVPVQQKPLWQGDLYFQQPAPVQQPMPMPSWQQTHLHFQPSFEQTMAAPTQQPAVMPQMMPQQPIIIQQPQQHHQPIFMEHPMPWPQPMPQIMPQMMAPMPMPMPICQKCHNQMMEEPQHVMPIREEDSPTSQMPRCPDRENQIRHYYEEIQQMMCMPNPCFPPQMMPYQMNNMPQMNPMQQMNPMPQMTPMPYPPKSCR